MGGRRRGAAADAIGLLSVCEQTMEGWRGRGAAADARPTVRVDKRWRGRRGWGVAADARPNVRGR